MTKERIARIVEAIIVPPACLLALFGGLMFGWLAGLFDQRPDPPAPTYDRWEASAREYLKARSR